MFTIPNLLSTLRLPLALVFLKQDVLYRVVALVLAMISDGLDGYLARKYKQSSAFGTVLDPMMDRFFVFFLIGIFINEGSLGIWEAGTLVCRDFAVMLFGFYLVFTGKLSSYRFRAIWCGKATTFCQFMVFLALTVGSTVPPIMFSFFIVLGCLALLELYLSKEQNPATLS